MNKIILITILIFSLVLNGCRKKNYYDSNLTTQIITSDGGTINAPDSVSVIFPQGTFSESTVVSVGYTGNENLIIENTGAIVLGKPLTIKFTIDSLLKDVQIKIPKPVGYSSSDKIAIIASINPKIPLYFVEDGKYLVANLDNLPFAIAKLILEPTAKEIVIGIVADKHLPIDNELGLKEVTIDVNGKLIFTNLTNISANDKVLLMVHGWTSSPSECWGEFIKKIKAQISQSGYTKFVTFGYYSGSPIDNNGALLANKIQNQLNGATIDIIAHSMGGLVSRSAIENYNMASKVRNLITLGTPHKGSTVSYLRQLVGRLFKTKDAYFNQSIDLNTQGMKDLQPNSVFLFGLSINSAPSTNYYPIAGIYDFGGVIRNSDGVVGLESALGIQNNSNGSNGKIFTFNFSILPNVYTDFQITAVPHVILTSDDLVISHVATKLNSYNTQSISCIDGDGYTYPTKSIGGNIWMTENIKSVTDSNGGGLTSWSYKPYYLDNNNINNKVGYLYLPQYCSNVLPKGFRLPTKTDLDNLLSEANASGDAVNFLENTLGFDLRYGGYGNYDDGMFTGWSDAQGNPSTHFTGLNDISVYISSTLSTPCTGYCTEKYWALVVDKIAHTANVQEVGYRDTWWSSGAGATINRYYAFSLRGVKN